MATEKEKIAARIRALLAKTVENGCTEDEAIEAARKAAEMLEKYNLTMDEVRLRESPFARHTEHHEDLVGERLWKVASAISHLTGARHWTSRAGVHPVEINFFGFDHEVEVAKYLLEICARAMRQEHKRLRRSLAILTKEARRRKIIPFLDGMADSLHFRIKALKPAEPTGKGLIALRNELIDTAMKDAGIRLEDAKRRPSRDLEDSYRDGVRAGESVSLNRGVSGPETSSGRLLADR